jgi:hypothetical protein
VKKGKRNDRPLLYIVLFFVFRALRGSRSIDAFTPKIKGFKGFGKKENKKIKKK